MSDYNTNQLEYLLNHKDELYVVEQLLAMKITPYIRVIIYKEFCRIYGKGKNPDFLVLLEAEDDPQGT